MNAPRRYTTEAGALQDVAIPALLKPLPHSTDAADLVHADLHAGLAAAFNQAGTQPVHPRRNDQRQELVTSYAQAIALAVRLRQCITALDAQTPRT